MIIIRVILSWFPVPSGELFRTVYRFIYELTEPVLAFFRKILPSIAMGSMGLDLSPIIVIFVLEILRYCLVSIIIRLVFACF